MPEQSNNAQYETHMSAKLVLPPQIQANLKPSYN